MSMSRLNRIVEGPIRILGVLIAGALLAACDEPQPRNFADFTEDRIAREGTLARCNADRDGTLNDIECANARRADAAIALRRERSRRELLEQESERKLASLRDQMALQDQRARDAERRAVEAEKAAYEALWDEDRNGGRDVAAAAYPLDLVEVPVAARAVKPTDSGPRLEEIVVPRVFRRVD
jgi:hypothetical protein